MFVLHKFLVKLSSREEIAALSDVHMQKDMKVTIDRDRMLLQYTLRRDFQSRIATVLTSLQSRVVFLFLFTFSQKKLTAPSRHLNKKTNLPQQPAPTKLQLETIYNNILLNIITFLNKT